ncbi:hypothetical protein DL96DRAFT_1714913 [Flagelloscypha sp. PMI_526]|nr:hypothetical protein DL96DRAFT_1714913 [Flagelloscypha sp. PMI_526]
MAHSFTKEASAAIIFLAAYTFLFVCLLFGYLTRRLKWKSRYSTILFHVVVRIASQACGVAYGIYGFENPHLFNAYLILGAEGYFTLVLVAYRFLISWQEKHIPTHISWIAPPHEGSPRRRRVQILLTIIFFPAGLWMGRKNFMTWIHVFLTIANALIVAGGSYLAGADFHHLTSADTINRLNIAKALRTTGQSIFLVCNFFFGFVIVRTILQDKKEIKSRVGHIHPTLIILLLAWFPLMLRGIFGVLQSADFALSYFNPKNYSSNGFSSQFTAIEYGLGVLQEWLAATLILSTYITSRHDPSKRSYQTQGKKEADIEST